MPVSECGGNGHADLKHSLSQVGRNTQRFVLALTSSLPVMLFLGV